MKVILDPPATLKAFLDARARGATAEELKVLISADEAARAVSPQREESESIVIDFQRTRRSRKAARQGAGLNV